MSVAHEGTPGAATSKLLRFGVPLIVGILVDGAYELLKFAAHYQREDGFSSLRDIPGTLFLWVVSIALAVASTFLLERFSDRNPLIRAVLLVVSLALVGALDPWGVLLNRRPMLEAYNKIQCGEYLHDVTKGMTTEPLVIATKSTLRHTATAVPTIAGSG